MKQYTIELSKGQREELEKRVRSGKATARSIQHAQILLKSDEGSDGSKWSDEHPEEAFGVSASTSYRVRKQFLKQASSFTGSP
jgi:hypothetical protein